MKTVEIPLVIWITGLPGSGKTTLAAGILDYLKLNSNLSFFHLDGDVMRREIFPEFGYSREQRHKISFYYQKIAKLLVEQRINVIVSTVSMFEDIYETNRSTFLNYIEIFLDPSLNYLQNGPRRDLYNIKNQDLNPNHDNFYPRFSNLRLTANTDKDRELWLETALNYMQKNGKLA